MVNEILLEPFFRNLVLSCVKIIFGLIPKSFSVNTLIVYLFCCHSCTPPLADWTEEYHGYLMANHHGYYATEFICVDHEAEGIPRTGHDNDPSLLYMAEGVCSGNGGGLPCPPYIDGHEVTCVVCSL